MLFYPALAKANGGVQAGQGRFGRSPERTKIRKSGTLTMNRCCFEKTFNHEQQKQQKQQTQQQQQQQHKQNISDSTTAI